MFLLVIGATDIAKVPGISAAGANVDILPFTAPADADMLWWGRPRVVDAIPVDPQGHPTPAIITRAAQIEAGFPVLTVRAGSFVAPACPHVEMGAEPGGDPRIGASVKGAKDLFERAMFLGAQLAFGKDRIVIGESVPGGTTTAYFLLKALGFDGMVSSAGPENPVSLKQKAWEDVAVRLKREGFSPESDPLDLAAQVGDPMQIVVAGLVAGIPGGVDITLAGGTQMLAVAALLRKMKVQRAPRVATTCYVSRDEGAHFSDLAMAIGVRTWSAPLDFSASSFTGLSDYEKGFVKEGVGAGGSVWYAKQLGVPVEKIIDRAEMLYAEMTGQGATPKA